MKYRYIKFYVGAPRILRENVERVGEVFYEQKLLIADIISLSAIVSNTSSGPRPFPQ
jgi:hypothetical protein